MKMEREIEQLQRHNYRTAIEIMKIKAECKDLEQDNITL